MQEIKDIIQYSNHNEMDIIVYSSAIDRAGYNTFCNKIPKQRKKKLLLVLSTFGGDPDAGFRIARAAAHYYGNENFFILVPGYCKSAGTLVCIGASKLIMMDRSELGPLDVQVQKNDEIYQLNSGLDIIRGMFYLQNDALNSFKRFLFDLNSNGGIRTRTAAKISCKLVTGLYAPLIGQIDPIKLGEMNAALQIASEYGKRLDEKSKSLRKDALNSLIHNYPSHGFVIDRAEARKLFKHVNKANVVEEQLGNFVYTEWSKDMRARQIYNFTERYNENERTDVNDPNQNVSTDRKTVDGTTTGTSGKPQQE